MPGFKEKGQEDAESYQCHGVSYLLQNSGFAAASCTGTGLRDCYRSANKLELIDFIWFYKVIWNKKYILMKLVVAQQKLLWNPLYSPVPRPEEWARIIVWNLGNKFGILQISLYLTSLLYVESVLKCPNIELMGTGESQLEQLVVTCQETVNFSKR